MTQVEDGASHTPPLLDQLATETETPLPSTSNLDSHSEQVSHEQQDTNHHEPLSQGLQDLSISPSDEQPLTEDLAPPSETTPVQPQEPQAEQPQVVEEEYPLKTIPWPPLPAPPSFSDSHGAHLVTGGSVRIICQNANGPCSLIALCNVLILRGDIEINPPSRRTANYSYLSSLVADYLLRTSTTTSESLSSALSILPTTQFGLNLNPRFGSIDGFRNSSFTSTTESEESGELALYRLARVPLLHGWVVDPQDEELWDVVVENCGDYDSALIKLVEGDVLSGESTVDLDNATEEEVMRAVERRSQWTPEEEKKVRDAHEIRKFLDSSQTQLTYHGLFLLSSHLAPSSFSAFFRNSHLSVIFRRPSLPSSPENFASSGPELFTLVTDSTFAGEENVVWESLEDVDGGASDFYDGALRKSDIRGGDWVGTRRGRRNTGERRDENNTREEIWERERELGDQTYDPRDVRIGETVPSDDPDTALARQLQSEEDEYARQQRRLARRQQEERDEREDRRNRTEPQRLPPPATVFLDRGCEEGRRGREPPKARPGKPEKAEKKKGDKCMIM